MEALAQKATLSGFIKIGEGSEFTEILVKPDDEKIYIAYGEDPGSSATLEIEETIWRELIMASGVRIDDGAQQTPCTRRAKRTRVTRGEGRR